MIILAANAAEIFIEKNMINTESLFTLYYIVIIENLNIYLNNILLLNSALIIAKIQLIFVF